MEKFTIKSTVKTARKLEDFGRSDLGDRHPQLINNRKRGKLGVLIGAVPNFSDMVWLVRHADNTVAAYWTFEFDVIETPP